MGHVLSRKTAGRPSPVDAQLVHSVKKNGNPLEAPPSSLPSPPPPKCQTGRLAPPTPTPKMSSSDSNGGDEHILRALPDERARELLRMTWRNEFDFLYVLGTDIYAEIFRLEPDVKNLFTDLNAYDLTENPQALKECSAFGKQALRFVQTVAMAVGNCGQLQEIDEYLIDIGRRHIQYKKRGFRAEHWQLFEIAICNVMAERANADKSLPLEDRVRLVQSWKRLTRHVIAMMTVGFRGER